MKNLAFAFIVLMMIFSCTKQQNKTSQKEKQTDSIFLLDSKWQNQDGQELQLADLKGKNLIMVMIFTRCQTACPVLVGDMKKVKSLIDPKILKNTSLVFISVDPENDTPEVLKKYAEERNMTGEPWVFLRSDTESTRELANVLAVKYKKISPIVFSHSNIITVFNKNGEMVSQEEGTVKAEAIAASVNQLK